jgi:hypothetical protein
MLIAGPSRISRSIGLHLLLLQTAAAQAVTPTMSFISARSSTKSPAFERGGAMRSSPEGRIATF